MSLPFVWSLVLVAAGVVLLVLFLIGTFRSLRRLRAAQERVAADFGERSGLIRARVAGVKVAVAERRRGAA